jgi:hypothetical protein
MATSAAPDSSRYERRTWWFVYGVWAAMTLQALVFVIRYPHTGPIIDEWEFIPALTDEEPFWPWLWKLHNEHRFPLPRLIYYPLFKLTHDFRTGCYLSLLGVSAVALLMISTARRLRGRLHFADAFFPLSLLHIGHWENWRMGYQIVFMMNLAFAAILLRIIVLTNRQNLLRRGIEAGFVTLALLACGAGGLAYGPFMAVWLLALGYWWWRANSAHRGKVLWLVVLAAIVPVYVWLYLQGYTRPSHHPDPLAVWRNYETAAWQALRSGMQALIMAFGPAAGGPTDSGLWVVSAIIMFMVCFECVLFLARLLATRVDERPRALGLLLYLVAVAFMAFGIGWGRSGFTTKTGEPSFMGLQSRYGWIAWPAIGAIYFQWLIFGSERLARWVPIVMFGIVVVMLPFNIGTGIQEGEKFKAYNEQWEQSVRQGMGDDELIQKYYWNYYGELKERMQVGLYLLRKHHIQYFRPLPEADAPTLRQRRWPRRTIREGPRR